MLSPHKWKMVGLPGTFSNTSFSYYYPLGTLSAETNTTSDEDLGQGEIATCFLPSSLFLLIPADENVSVIFAVYEQSTLLPVLQQDSATEVGTPILAATVAGQTFDNLTDPITLIFRLTIQVWLQQCVHQSVTFFIQNCLEFWHYIMKW